LWASAEKIWDALVTEITARDGRVCGLGARDTLRTEMGYPLHGHELSLSITPIQASSGWAVGMKKPTFWGKAICEKEKEGGPHRVLRALKSLDRGIPRAGMKVLSQDNSDIGEVTSGTFSPTLRVGIALALIKPTHGIGEKVRIDIRGRVSEAEIVKVPLVPSRVK
jgi:aminomethyltransferase